MQDHIDRAIDTYKNGEVYDQTSDEFTKMKMDSNYIFRCNISILV